MVDKHFGLPTRRACGRSLAASCTSVICTFIRCPGDSEISLRTNGRLEEAPCIAVLDVDKSKTTTGLIPCVFVNALTELFGGSGM